MEIQNENNLAQKYSPAGEFLQSSFWRTFQESVGRKVYFFSGENINASIIEHSLPIVGKYFYIPRGPILKNQNDNEKLENDFNELIKLAKENKAGWIRIDPVNKEILGIIKNFVGAVGTGFKPVPVIVSAPHNMQPKEIFVVDIFKSEDELLAQMKPKTRYNIRLAEKKGVEIFSSRGEKDISEFLRLTQVMAKRNGIVAHPESYYQKMLENISSDILKLYVAEYQGKIIAANLVIFYGENCVYLHGASDDECRSVMAPYLLQWQQIRDAKEVGCTKYDFGGIKMLEDLNLKNKKSATDWAGITKFKLGFSPKTPATVFSGSYDIVINQKKYWLYRAIQKIKSVGKF